MRMFIGAYYHELFLRSRPDLCLSMGRVKSLDSSDRMLREEPDFYSMDPVGDPRSGVAASALRERDPLPQSGSDPGEATGAVSSSSSSIREERKIAGSGQESVASQPSLAQLSRQAVGSATSAASRSIVAPPQIFQPGGPGLEEIFNQLFPPPSQAAALALRASPGMGQPVTRDPQTSETLPPGSTVASGFATLTYASRTATNQGPMIPAGEHQASEATMDRVSFPTPFPGMTDRSAASANPFQEMKTSADTTPRRSRPDPKRGRSESHDRKPAAAPTQPGVGKSSSSSSPEDDLAGMGVRDVATMAHFLDDVDLDSSDDEGGHHRRTNV